MFVCKVGIFVFIALLKCSSSVLFMGNLLCKVAEPSQNKKVVKIFNLLNKNSSLDAKHYYQIFLEYKLTNCFFLNLLGKQLNDSNDAKVRY